MTSKINPSHYTLTINGHTFEVVDLMEACFPQDMHLAQAFKYMMRAGRKSDSSYIEDVGKCLWWCARSIMFHGGKSIELPDGIKSTSTDTMKAEKPKRAYKKKTGHGTG